MRLIPKIVPKWSACIPGLADAEEVLVHKDHRSMVKFESQDDGDYRTISSIISRMSKDAPSKVEENWRKFRGGS